MTEKKPIQRSYRTLFHGWLVFAVLLIVVGKISAQTSCGVVDALDYPIEGLVPGYDDFGLYRQRFGGNHTGLDIGFDRWGEPVYATARGRVTYADPEGWGTEKGVVVIQHTFPDGSVVYSVYGHMEESDTIVFPQVGSCVERGTVIGTIGWPSQGRPHLHYELRNFLPYEGGPGYVTDNPLDDGWYDPLDFTTLWRVRLTPVFLDSITFNRPATLPPVRLESGLYVIASHDFIIAMQPSGQVVWRVKADSAIIGLSALPGDRIAAQAQSGQVSILQDGRYQAVWNVGKTNEPFLALGEDLVFITDAAGLAAHDAAGNTLWQIPATTGSTTVFFGLNGEQIAWAVQSAGGVTWQIISRNGQSIVQIALTALSAADSLPDGSWLALEGSQLVRLNDGVQQVLAALPVTPGNSAQITTDAPGNIYLYMDDAANTLLSTDSLGHMRWQTVYSGVRGADPPLLRAGCQLYTLDADGLLHIFKAADGSAFTPLQLYAGGRRNTSPEGRVLRLDGTEHVQAAPGFLTMMTLDGTRLGSGCS
jgi:peptidase M23-like protein/putative pyrroloquinoline-quinone binding quinoprotein